MDYQLKQWTTNQLQLIFTLNSFISIYKIKYSSKDGAMRINKNIQNTETNREYYLNSGW